MLVVGEIEGLFFLRVSHAKRKFEPTERLASTHIHTSFQHRQHSLNTFHTHSVASMKRDRRKSLLPTWCQYYCNTIAIAQYSTPPRPSVCMPYTIRYSTWYLPYMLNTRNEEKNTVLYSRLACFVNTFTLNMYVSMSYTG